MTKIAVGRPPGARGHATLEEMRSGLAPRRAFGLALVAMLAAGSLGLTCGPGLAPVSETCTPAVAADAGELPGGTLTSVEIGYLDGSGGFLPFVDQSVASLQFGGQGSTMYVAHLRLHGSGVPACVPQKTYLEQLDGTVISSEDAAMATDPAGTGTWITGAMYLVYDRATGVQVRLRTEVLGMQRSVVVWVDTAGTVDAGVDLDAGFAP